jgi:D-glycero-D-manno-heptose 1,7-bisphosphate phosphatase
MIFDRPQSDKRMPLVPAIFVDRDNTLTVDEGYSFEIDKFQWVQGAPAALRAFRAAGLPVFIVTNQGGIGRGFFTLDDMHRFHQHLMAMAHKEGGAIQDIAYCPHHPNAVTAALKTPCRCRKPKAGLLFDLAEKWQLDLRRSVMIGDRKSDIEAGQNAGCHSYLFDGDDLGALATDIIATHFQVTGGVT